MTSNLPTNKLKYQLLGLVLMAVILVVLFSYKDFGRANVPPEMDPATNQTEDEAVKDEAIEDEDNDGALPTKVVIANVPFTSQAPTFEWDDPRQQDGCEEASVLMATRWLADKAIASPEEAKTEILTLSHLAEEMFGVYEESSVPDTLKLLQSYAHTKSGRVVADFSIMDVKKELAKNQIILIPFDGRKLNNPNFTGEGPDRHFLVVIGYDDKKGVFITNDPGTRKGRGYEYPYQVLFDAILDYPTGQHIPYSGTSRRMLVIAKD